MRASRTKEVVSKGKTTPMPEGLGSPLSGSYDYNNQRIYSYHPQDLYPKKFYYWSNGQIISEGVIDTQNASNSTDYSVRYFYSGNQKIAMERRDMSTGQTSLYYFINNAQGTPVLILDSTGGIKSKINLDEWGNVGMLQGPSQEINFTGKKLDTATGLFYFNQRYYDPEIGRFLQEDPAGQGLNPYRYCGNNPLMYTDPDGEWFFAFIIAAMVEGAKAAALNTLTQVVTNGFNFQKINGDSVMQSFTRGMIGGAIGEKQWVTPGGDDWLSHGIAGAANGAINGGLTNVAYGSVTGQNMSLDNAWNKFGEGTGPGAIAGFCKGVYKHQTKFSKVDSGPGLNGPDPDKFGATPAIGAVENANNIWFPIGEEEDSLIKNIFREGGPVSAPMNYFLPGVNAMAGLHDWWGAMYGWTNSGYGCGTILSLSISAGITYGALSSPGRY